MANEITNEQAVDMFLTHRYGYFPDTSVASLSRALEGLTAAQIATLYYLPLKTPPNDSMARFVFTGFFGINRFKEGHIGFGLFKFIYTILLLVILPFAFVVGRFQNKVNQELNSVISEMQSMYQSMGLDYDVREAKELLGVNMSFNELFSYSLEWIAEEPYVYILPLVFFGVIAVALYILDGMNMVKSIKRKNLKLTNENIGKIKTGAIPVLEETVNLFVRDLSIKDLIKNNNSHIDGRRPEHISETAHIAAEVAKNAAETVVAEAKTIAKAGLPFLKEFVKRPSGAIRDYCMGLKECLTIAGLQAFGAAVAALVVVGKSSLWSSLLSFFSYRRANLFFGVFFVCLLGAAVFCGFLLLFGKIFRGGITGENAKARLLSSAAAAQIPMTAAFLLSIIMGFIYSPLIIALVVFGLMAGVVLTMIIYKEVFGLTEDNAMYASVTAWTAQVVAILLILSN